MADERRIHSAITVELFLKGKYHQRFVDGVSDKARSPLAPRPELRCDVVDDGNAALFHLPRHAPVERGRVDDDGEIWPALVDFLDQVLVEAVDLWQMAEDFGDADNGEIFRVNDSIAAGRAHAISANAEEFKSLIAATQGLDELRAIHFSGSFAG